MTTEEARQHINNLSNLKANRLVSASYKSTSITFDDHYLRLSSLANEAKKVLGIHQFQRPFEVLVKQYPGMTREYYDKKRKEENIS